MNAARVDVLLGLVVALVTILTYIAWVLRKIRAAMRALQQYLEEHRLLLQAGHWHQHGRVIPLMPAAAPPLPPRHRRAEGPDRW